MSQGRQQGSEILSQLDNVSMDCLLDDRNDSGANGKYVRCVQLDVRRDALVGLAMFVG